MTRSCYESTLRWINPAKNRPALNRPTINQLYGEIFCDELFQQWIDPEMNRPCDESTHGVSTRNESFSTKFFFLSKEKIIYIVTYAFTKSKTIKLQK
jgi:hypothetical protein